MSGASATRAVNVPRVLVVAANATALAPACAEMMRRGALCSISGGIKEAAASARETPFDAILVMAREGGPETLLLLQLLRAEARGNPRLILLVDPQHATAYVQQATLADAMLAATLAPERIAEAAGVAQPQAEAAPNLPMVVAQERARVLALPTPLRAEQLPDGIVPVKERGEVPDAVVLTDASGAHLITSWMSAAAAAVVPVIDATGRQRARADATLSTLTASGLDQALSETEPIRARMRDLPEGYFRSRDARSFLMARLATRDRAAAPRRDAGIKSTVTYPDELAVAALVPVAESLVRTGHMTRRFMDRVQCCPTCTSARVSVREECAKCRSANVVEEPIIHHLRCGYQGPERDFRVSGKDGDKLVCPKCRLHLEHFSVDYDKPGALHLCEDCGHVSGEVAIGFLCLDCDSHHDSEAMRPRDVHAYALTDEGRQAAFLPPIDSRGGGMGAGATPLREQMRAFVARNQARGQPHAVLMIRLDTTGGARAAAGERLWRDTVALFASILQELFTPDTQIAELGDAFVVMISNEARARVEASVPQIRSELERDIAVPLGARYDVLGPDQLSNFL